MEFTGWPPEAFDWFEALAANNSKQWFHANRSTYDDAVRGPTEALMDDLAPEFGELTVSRPNRDIRFAKDKAPYRPEIYVRSRTEGGGYYARLGPDGLFAGGGLYGPDRERLARVRAAIDDDRSGAELERIVADLEGDGMRLLRDGALKTAPRGFAKDHPRIELLRLPHVGIGIDFARARWMHTPEAEERIVATWRSLAPLLAWLARTS